MPKVKKAGLILAVVLLSLVLTSSQAKAQYLDAQEKQRLDQALQDYSYQFSKYEDCHNKYITDRSTYLSFQTATAKNTAFLTTKDCLSKVYNVYVAYLRYVKEQGNTFNWNKKDAEKNQIFKTLDDEIANYQNNQKNVDTLQTLDDTVPYAADLKIYVTKTTYPIVLKALATYDVAESEAALENFVNLSQDLRTFVTSRIDEKQYASFLANWDTEVANIRSTSQSSNADARKALDKIKPTSNDPTTLAGIDKATATTKDQLERAKNIFSEILKTI